MMRFLSLCCAGIALFTSPLRAALVGYWPFNDAASLGNGGAAGTLTANAGATFTAAGKFGGGLALNGAGGFLSGTVTNLPIGNSNYTQAAWFKPTALGARGIVGWGNFGSGRQVNALRIFDNGNGFRHYWWGADLDAVNLPTNFLDGNWHHVATTFDGTTRRIYLDGVQVNSDVPGTNNASAANFRIGCTNNTEYFSGTLDEVYIYNNALTAAEVQSLAAGLGPRITSFTCNKSTAYEGESVQLNWTVDVSTVTGTYGCEIKYGNTTLNSGTAATGSFNTVVPDLAGTAQTVTFTFRAIETGGNNVTITSTASVQADPGIPTATGQTGLSVQSGTPLGITLAGTDPNNGALTYTVVTPPAKGTVSPGTGASRSYTATAGMYGQDSFTFKVSDGKYESAPAQVRLNILTPPLAPTAVTIDDTTVLPTNVAGDFLSNISTTDANAGEAHTYTLVSGAGSNENGNFSISGHQLRAATSFAALTGVPQRIRIRSTDGSGLSVEGSFVLTVAPKNRRVVINEIYYNGADNTVLNSFIELYNDTGAPVNLSGWRISGGVDYVFPAGTTMAPGTYLLVSEDPATMQSYWGKTALGPWDHAITVYPDGAKETNGLSNDGATVRLRDASDKIVSEVDYEPRSPWPAEGNGEGSSIELINPALDEAHGSNWASAKSATTAAPDFTYIPAASNAWKFFKGTSAPPTNWNARTGFDDSTWLPGTTSIGYGDADDATLIPEMQSGYQSIYLRHTFNVPAGSIPAALALRVYVDDGCIVWINGQEIPRRFFISAGTPGHQPANPLLLSGITVSDHEALTLGWEAYTITGAQTYLVEGTNVIAVLAANASLASTDFSFDLELKKGVGNDAASPGAQNLTFAANTAPAIRKVEHTPQTPASTDAIVVTAKITDPNGVASASLAYQICTAGNFIPSTLPKAISGGNFVNVAAPLAPNPAFEAAANWTTLAMNDDGLGDDALGGDGIWTGTIPPQQNRTLVRYRITVADNLGATARVPYAADPSRNFACFVYNGVPAYLTTSAADLQKLPVYHFLTRKADYDQCVAYDANAASRLVAGLSWTFENWEACFVSNGVVYDHIPYRLKGANGRYTASGTGGVGNGKRAFKFLFNKGHEFDARDGKGNPYPEKWSTMITENCWENRATYTFSLNEMVSFHLWNKLGVPAPRGNWGHFRTIMQTAEQPDQWHGDFWGLIWVHEDYDRRFVKAHGLPKGNLYKLTRDGTAGSLQFRYQAAFAPKDNSDHDELLANLKGTSTPAYITGRVNLGLWARYHAFAEAIRHYDYWPSGDNNAGWYFYPKYDATNSNKGVLWYLPNDVDATWGPTWNNGHDLVHNSLFNDSASAGGDASTNPTLWPVYFNQVREIRTLLWQPDQINPLIDEFADVIRPIANADYQRWLGAPADAGNYNGLNTYGTVGQTALNNYVASMKDFAFDPDNNGSSWPGGNVGAGGRAAFLDQLGNSLGENSTKYPATPVLAYSGPAGYPLNDLRFTTSAFNDPQGANTFAGIQWRIAEVNTSATYNPAEPRLLEIEASFDSGELPAFVSEFKYPATSCTPGHRYRARVRMKDDTGRWSNWSAAVEFTAGTFDPSAFASALVVSEIMYHAPNPTAAEQAVAAAQSPAQIWTDDDFDYIELRNVSGSPLNLSGLQFTQGFDYTFPPNTVLNAGASVVLVQNPLAFTTRYGANSAVLGGWDPNDKLSNGGEALTLRYGQLETPVFSFAYDDDTSLNWPSSPDGSGASLVRIAPEDTTRDPGLGINWRSSLVPGGSPGGDDRQTFAAWMTANSQSNATADTDRDGFTTLAEYAMGGNPAADSSSALQPVAQYQSVTVGDATSIYITLAFRRANAADHVTQSVEFSTDLTTWPEAGVQLSSFDNGDGTRTEVWRSATPYESGRRVFGRVKFTAP
jgi:hypothetical protein